MADDKDTISLEFTDEEKTQLAELEEKYGRIYPFRVKGHGLIVFRKPLRPEWRKYNNDLRKPQVDQVILNENIAKNLAVGPSNKETIDRVLDDYPGLVDVFEIAIRNLAIGENSDVAALGKDWKTPEATI